MLDRKLADRGHFPAIDVLASNSRVMGDVVHPDHRATSLKMRGGLADLREAEELLTFGAYHRGAVARFDRALDMREPLLEFLTQGQHESAPYDGVVQNVAQLAAQLSGGQR